jgi:hypothetical protein
MITWDGGRCSTCSDPSIITEGGCTGAGLAWQVATAQDTGDLDNDGDTDEMCDETIWGCLDVYTITDCPTYVAEGDTDDGWIPFVDDWQTAEEETGGPSDECSCTASSASSQAEFSCAALGDMNGDNFYNILDIVTLANCILVGNCADLPNGCAGDLNGDNGYNVLDIVTLANCILAGTCGGDGGRVDDASESRLIIQDNMVSIEAVGFIGGVQMTLSHGDNFMIEMTSLALFADYLTNGNETRLLVINPETSKLFSYKTDFKILDIIVANSHEEISVDYMIISDYSLGEAYPNPFNPVTNIDYSLPVPSNICIMISDGTGN